MSQTVSDHLLGRLAAEWGVSRIYGYPGDGINGLIGAFARGGSGGSSIVGGRKGPGTRELLTQPPELCRSDDAPRPPTPVDGVEDNRARRGTKVEAVVE